MAFDQPTRNRLARFVADARSLLTGEFTRQLQNDYGMDPRRGEVADLARLGHLDDSRRETARILRGTLAHYLASIPKSGAKAQQEALDRIVREQAFTVLNRLCALRMAEARGLLIESVGSGPQSQGFQLYARLAGSALGETGDAYRSYLFSLFDEFAADLAVLFDRFSPQGRLFPGQTALIELLDKINDPDLEPLWAEDETIGWIYQYFNSQEERRQMRAESQAPRNSRELAVRNQFFTPRYVVEFLTDNTLGRIWYEMTRGETALTERCRYLVRRPNEIFLGYHEWDKEGRPAWIEEALSGNFAALPEEPEEEGLAQLSLAIDGYGLAQQHGYGGLLEWADERIEHARTTGAWPDSALELWLIMFRMQRTWGRADYPLPDSFFAEWRSVYGKLRSALQNPPEDLSQEEMLNQPVYIPRRLPKDPRQIKMLDPACGSMHFGLYAFDLFEQIYEEAWRWGWVPPEDFGYRPQASFDHASVDLDPSAVPTSNYSGQPVAVDDAYVVIASRGDGGDGVRPGYPYLVTATTQFRVPFTYRVPLSDFDYGRELTAGTFGPAAGEALVRATHAFTFAEAPAVSHDEAYANFRRQIPRLIIEHNIHGIDIDPRAVQIAGLSLWLRGQRSWQEQGVKPQDRPTIRKSNIVCAEPMPGDRRLLEEFLNELRDERLEGLIRQVIRVPANQRVRATPSMADALCDLVRTVWDEMTLAGEAGSLLKIEESLAAAIERGRAEWETRLPLFRVETFRMTGEATDEKPTVNYLKVVPGEGVDFWDRAEALVLAALEEYAAQAENGAGYQRRLFAQDAARGFAFIDLCRKRYDVVLMNPPFGENGLAIKDWIVKSYPLTNKDLYAAFVERGTTLLNPKSIIGAITSRTGFFLSSFQQWRENIILGQNPPFVFADLGSGVLDSALVETAAYCLSNTIYNGAYFFRLLDKNADEKAPNLCECIKGVKQYQLMSNLFLRNPMLFTEVPSSPFGYWFSSNIRGLFRKFSVLETPPRESRRGSWAGNDFRYLRLWFEVSSDTRGRNQRWVQFAKGGDYSTYYYNFPLLVDWDESRKTFRAFLGRKGRENPKPESLGYYFRPAISWPLRTALGLNVRVLPEGFIFANVNPCVFDNSTASLLILLGLMNSSVFKGLLNFFQGAAAFQVGVVQRIPIPNLDNMQAERIGNLALLNFRLKQNIDTTNECSHLFYVPHLLHENGESLDLRASNWLSALDKSQYSLSRYQAEIDEISCMLYEIHETDRQALEQTMVGAVGFDPDTASEPASDDDTSPESPQNIIEFSLSLIS